MDDFKSHFTSERHQNVLKNEAARKNMRDAQAKAVSKRYHGELDKAGSILVIVAWMIVCGMSMRLFPAVCS